MFLRSIIIYGICVSLYAVLFCMEVAPEARSLLERTVATCFYLIFNMVYAWFQPPFLSLSYPHPSKSPSSFAGSYSECGADGEWNSTSCFDQTLVKSMGSFPVRGEDWWRRVFPKAKKFPTWNLHKMLCRHWSGIIEMAGTQMWGCHSVAHEPLHVGTSFGSIWVTDQCPPTGNSWLSAEWRKLL